MFRAEDETCALHRRSGSNLGLTKFDNVATMSLFTKEQQQPRIISGIRPESFYQATIKWLDYEGNQDTCEGFIVSYPFPLFRPQVEVTWGFYFGMQGIKDVVDRK